MALADIPVIGKAQELLYGAPKKTNPAAFDDAHPNLRGYDTRPMLRLVESRSQMEVLAVQLPLRPKAIQRTAEVRMAIHGTAGGYHVDRPKTTAHGLVHYVLTGNSGQWPAGKKDGAPDGMAAVHRLKQILDLFAGGEIQGRPASEFELWFIDPNSPVTEEDACGDSLYSVIPDKSLVDLQQTGQTGGTYNYTIRLACIDRPDGVYAGRHFNDKKREQSLLSKILDGIAVINEFSFDNLMAKYKQLIAPLLRVKAALRDIRAFLEGWARGGRAFVAYNVGLFDSTVNDLQGILNTVRGDEASPDRARSPEDRFGDDGRTLRQVQRVKLTLARIRDHLGASPGALSSRLQQQGGTLGQRRGLAGEQTPMQGASALRRMSPADQQDRRPLATQANARMGSRIVAVGPGQMIEDLVPSGFTDLDLLRLNPDLQYPYVDGTRQRPDGEAAPEAGTFRVAYQGDLVRVPDTGGGAAATARGANPGAALAQNPNESEDARIFGVDWYVNPETRAWEFDPATNDVRTIAGVPNLLQRLRHSLIIPLGSLRADPTAGSYLLAESQGRWGGDLQNRLNRIAVARTIRQDPAIAAVRRVRVTQSNGRTDVTFEADTVAGTPLGQQALAV